MVQRVNILGVGISAIDPQSTLDVMARWIDSGQRHYICVCAVHTVMECQDDPELRGMVNRASLAVPDGMPLVWVSRLAGQSQVDRVYGPDLMMSFCDLAAQQGYSNYFLGGAVGQPKTLAKRLTARFPGLSIAGMSPTPKRPLPRAENEDVIEEINRADPDVVWVGMGTGYQERWVAENRGRLNAPILIGVGAAFDMHSGMVRQAPHWMQSVGLEWFFRLLQEPGRLWRRYLLGNPLFVARLIAQRFGWRRYRLNGQVSVASAPRVPQQPGVPSTDMVSTEPKPEPEHSAIL
jgi:N-acetylglucosaminyldiphosphoundecaprenol N-acetyl-beta-D-mannosaminyltransferase